MKTRIKTNGERPGMARERPGVRQSPGAFIGDVRCGMVCSGALIGRSRSKRQGTGRSPGLGGKFAADYKIGALGISDALRLENEIENATRAGIGLDRYAG